MGNSDGNINIWDFKNGEYFKMITVAENQDIFSIISMSFSPDNKYLAALDSNNKIQIWELESDRIIYDKEYSKGFRGVALSMETKLFATCKDDQINLYDFDSGEHTKKIEGSEESFCRVYFNSERTKLITLSFGNTIKLWDIKTGEELFSLPQKMYYSVAVHPHQEIIAATVKQSNKVEIWNLASRSLIRTIETSQYNNNSCDHTVRVWDVATGKQVKVMDNHTQTIQEVFFIDNDRTLISTSMDGDIRFWKI